MALARSLPTAGWPAAQPAATSSASTTLQPAGSQPKPAPAAARRHQQCAHLHHAALPRALLLLAAIRGQARHRLNGHPDLAAGVEHRGGGGAPRQRHQRRLLGLQLRHAAWRLRVGLACCRWGGGAGAGHSGKSPGAAPRASANRSCVGWRHRRQRRPAGGLHAFTAQPVTCKKRT